MHRFPLTLALLLLVQNNAASEEVNHRASSRDHQFASYPPTLMGAVGGGVIGLAFVDPGMENFGKNYAFFLGGTAAGAFAGYGAWKWALGNQPDPGDDFWRQDAAASTSMLLSSITAGAGTQPHLGIAAVSGVGLLGAELYTQKRIQTLWNQDSSRLRLLAGLQYGNACAAGLSLYDFSLGATMKSSPWGIAPLLLWPASYAVTALAEPDASAEKASARGYAVVLANILFAPTAAMFASRESDGDVDASLAAIAGVNAATMIAGPFLPPLPGTRNARYFACFGGMIGAAYGLSVELDEIDKETDVSPDAIDYRSARTEMWEYAAIGAATGAASGWLLGSLLFKDQLAEPVPPSASIGSDGRLAFGLGGIIIHLR